MTLNLTHLHIVADALAIPIKKVEATAQLLSEGATIPFLSRYRKEATGGLDEVQIGDIKSQLDKLDDVEKRRESILKSIEEQGKLTPELEKRIRDTYNMTLLEDIYLPYKRKKKTRASVAKEKGLEPLAILIFMQNDTDNTFKIAADYINENVANQEEALQGARDIIAEWISEDEQIRTKIRYYFEKEGLITSKVVRNKYEEGIK
jgi:uncharacterized protein